MGNPSWAPVSAMGLVGDHYNRTNSLKEWLLLLRRESVLVLSQKSLQGQSVELSSSQGPQQALCHYYLFRQL